MAKPKSYTPAKKTGETMTGKDVLYTVLMLKTEYGQDVAGLLNDTEYTELLTMMRHNKPQSKTFGGIKYTVAGFNAGRDNPSKGLKELIDSVDGKAVTQTGKKKKAPSGWAKLKWRTSRKASKCPVCSMSLGLDVKYTIRDEKTGEETIGKAPSYSLSHNIPSLFFGATDDSNVMVECRRCNSSRADRMPKEVRRWYESLVFDVYETEKTETETETETEY